MDAGFRLAPRINACGRLDDPGQALELLLTDSPTDAAALAQRLSMLNDQRRKDQKVIEEAAVAKVIERGMDSDDQRIIVLGDPAWNRGIVGIACTRLVERFHRPVLLLQEVDGMYVGSARSIPGFSIHGALAACSDHLTTWGGHEAAAGLSLPVEGLEAFTAAITAHSNERITVDDMVFSITIDTTIDAQEIDVDVFSALEDLRPHGKGNPRPVLHVQGMTIKDVKTIGKTGLHLALTLQPQGVNRWIRAIWWQKGELASELAGGGVVDVVFKPSLNTWQGNTKAELDIQDIRWSDSP
jgi:single-stranded-DNA-specific exonuclease